MNSDSVASSSIIIFALVIFSIDFTSSVEKGKGYSSPTFGRLILFDCISTSILFSYFGAKAKSFVPENLSLVKLSIKSVAE